MSTQESAYAKSGVSYGNLDPFKIACQHAARTTSENLDRRGFAEVEWTRGESCYVIQLPDGSFLGHVEETLGTKNLVADAMEMVTGKTYYDCISQDGAAMIVNDMITVIGMLPATLAMHFAVENGNWFSSNLVRSEALIEGWVRACHLSGASWGGGETPALKGIIEPGTALLSGSATGFARRIRRPCAEPGDAIIMLSSSGIHANGLTLAREIAKNTQDGLFTTLSDGKTYGEALLEPTYIYVKAMEVLLEFHTDIHQAINITGHGWRKLMRSPEDLVYYITDVGPTPPLFNFMETAGGISAEEMYSTFNMGAGFALIVDPDYVEPVLNLIRRYRFPFQAWHAGFVEEGKKAVVIEPRGIEFEGSSLQIR